jgi:hypothetical protein
LLGEMAQRKNVRCTVSALMRNAYYPKRFRFVHELVREYLGRGKARK